MSGIPSDADEGVIENMKENPMKNTNKTIEDVITEMVENTDMVWTNDLPSLLQTEEVANYRRVHKDQILKNLPKAKQSIRELVESALPEKRKGGGKSYHQLIRGYNQAIDDFIERLDKVME